MEQLSHETKHIKFQVVLLLKKNSDVYCEKKVKLLLEQLQVCIFAEMVFGVRCTLKQQADTMVKQPEAESNNLDGAAPLQTEPCVSNNEKLKTADVPVLHFSDTVPEASTLPGTETRHSSNDVEEVARMEICSPVAPLLRFRKKLAIKHGLHPSISAQFQISASGIFRGPESTFIDNLMDGSVAIAN